MNVGQCDTRTSSDVNSTVSQRRESSMGSLQGMTACAAWTAGAASVGRTVEDKASNCSRTIRCHTICRHHAKRIASLLVRASWMRQCDAHSRHSSAMATRWRRDGSRQPAVGHVQRAVRSRTVRDAWMDGHCVRAQRDSLNTSVLNEHGLPRHTCHLRYFPHSGCGLAKSKICNR